MNFKISFFAILISLLSFTFVNGQTVDEIKSDRATYIYGEGRGATIRQADNQALSVITSQISVFVKSDISSNDIERGVNDDLELESTFESIIETYSNATLSNTEMIIIENEPNAHIFRYIKRSDIERIFESRKDKIISMVEDADKALAKGQINDALRYLYWAHTLTKSLRHPNELYVKDSEGTNQMVNTWIPTRINEILSDLKITVHKIENKELVHLDITYNNEPAASIDYTYFDGLGWSNIYSAKDGYGIIELRKGFDNDKVQLKVEYSFEGEAVVDREIKSVLDILPASVYKKAYTSLSLKCNKEDIVEEEQLANDSKEEDSYQALSQVTDTAPYQSVIDTVLIAVKSGETSDIEHLFTPDGMKAYQSLIEYGSANVVDSSTPKYYSFGADTYCRNILMSFSFKNNNRTFIEGVVFEFNNENKISNVSFSLSRQAIDDIFSKAMWPEQARIILIHFLEGYKSAYALENINYIESVFAEDALIITGKYVRNATLAEMANINHEYVKYTKQSKSEYVRKLKYIFESNEYININFADSEILKAGKGGEIYGIQIKQEYHSTSYGDSGYLFLMVDLNDTQKPIIHVRTWQPAKDPNFGTYGLEHF